MVMLLNLIIFKFIVFFFFFFGGGGEVLDRIFIALDIRVQTFNCDFPGSSLLVASVVSLGKALILIA